MFDCRHVVYLSKDTAEPRKDFDLFISKIHKLFQNAWLWKNLLIIDQKLQSLMIICLPPADINFFQISSPVWLCYSAQTNLQCHISRQIEMKFS